MKPAAAVVGATGLIGTQLLTELGWGSPYSEIRSLTRRPSSVPSSKVKNQVVNFEKPGDLKPHLAIQDLFFCFGTTLHQAGSPEKFRQIEWGIGSSILEAAQVSGVQRLFMVSSMGASAKSRILYSQIKGELEDLARRLRFDVAWVLRPSLLLGERNESRFFEGISQKLTRPLAGRSWGPLNKYRPIQGDRVAQKLAELSYESEAGFHVLENEQLFPGRVTVSEVRAEDVWDLRQSLLRAHQPREKSIYPGDRLEGAIHWNAMIGARPVGIVSIAPETPPPAVKARTNLPTSMRLRGMAVGPSYRKHGVGQKLVFAVEEKVRSFGGGLVWFNARQVAFSFYEKLGYQYASELFEIEDIGPHKIMFKEIDAVRKKGP